MPMLKTIIAGAVLGFLGAIGIYFAPDEPYPGFITLAGTLNGITIALLISAVVKRKTSVAHSLLWGAAMGLLTSSAVFFAKGAWASWDAPFVVPTDTATGIILGPIVRLFGRDER